MSKLRIGELLQQKGLVTEDQVRIALIEQQKHKQPLGQLLVALGFLTEATLRDALGEALNQTSIDLASVVPDQEAISLVPLEIAKRFRVVPVSLQRESRQLMLAMADTFNVVALDQITALLGGRFSVQPLLAGEAEIAHAIDHFYGFALSIEAILQEIETGHGDQQKLSGDHEYSHPLVRLVDALILEAVKRRASDIHFEPEQGFLRIRHRVDGVLQQVRSLHAKYWPAIAVRLKVMATLNIAETRAPQDGRLALTLHGRTIDFRVSSLPTLHGENIVLRVLDRQAGILPMERLGIDDDALAALKLMIARPEGIILVTGPTGSGKTTTLYSILAAINTGGVNIMTLEDPVEYPMMGIRQSAVNEAVKLDFANGIRAMMRQDPDVILVGEIRDHDTAEMALRAAMTGHQVYSTLHTNSALGAIPRLIDLGVNPEILAGHIIGVVGQRLVRRLCVHCRERDVANETERRLLGELSGESPMVWRPRGCVHCAHHGYMGRLALMEVLRFDGDLDELVARRATLRELMRAAQSRHFRTLAHDGIRRALAGDTTLDEVSRVVDLTSRVA